MDIYPLKEILIRKNLSKEGHETEAEHLDRRIPKRDWDNKGVQYARIYFINTRPLPKVLHQEILVKVGIGPVILYDDDSV